MDTKWYMSADVRGIEYYKNYDKWYNFINVSGFILKIEMYVEGISKRTYVFI